MRHSLPMGSPTESDEPGRERTELEARLARTEQRAKNVRKHAMQARDEADRDHARGDDEAERLHLDEAETHERSARAIEKTAALYRQRINRWQSAQDRRDA